jgi:thimet oligopeptidase
VSLDLFPREGKYGHAAVFGIIAGRSEDYAETSYKAPFASMVANFNKPSELRPSLLSHDEVETFFHEFGHLVHNVLTTCRFGSQSGTSVAWDFVEAPSQMLEHFVWDKEMLNRLSKHYKLGKPLPDDALVNLLGSKMHMIATFVMRQLVFALYDLIIHTDQTVDSVSLYKDLVLKNLGHSPSPEQIFPAGFGHLMGYDAGYYGYMWSKVYAVDMFSRFKQSGLLDRGVGKDYRNWILEKGSSLEEIDLVKGFLGREPSNSPFLEEIGVK